jgi:UDP-GlcNAc:undecaprenyl-phosphate GlcNAc-1-phosphate transferase
MLSTCVALLLALIVTAMMTPLVRHLALAIGAVDEPTARRVHTRSIPRMGGIAIVVGFFAPLVALFSLHTGMARTILAQPKTIVALALGSLVIAGLGLLDDMVGVGAKRKLLVQTLAACIAYAGGLRIEAITLPFTSTISLGWLGLPVTILWITAIINALNLIDGLDGLAAGVAFFGCATNFVVAYLNNNLLICLFSAALGGAILGFLIYNFNPATIFMGDSGSMFLGFSLATISLLGSASQKSPTVIAILVPLLALGLPIMDMLFAMLRRFLERRSIFSPDRGHIHHRLLDLGLTHRRAVLVLYGLSLMFTLVALAIHLGRSWQIGAALLVLTASLVGIVRFVGYFNGILERRQLAQRDALTEALRARVPLALQQIDGARSVEDLPSLLTEFATQVRLLAVAIVAPAEARVSNWRWEYSDIGQHQSREAVCAKYRVTDAAGLPLELQFFYDSPTGAVGPQAEILLQLVADAAESLLQRQARARIASRGGRLRPVS